MHLFNFIIVLRIKCRLAVVSCSYGPGNPTTSLFTEGLAKGATIRQTITAMDCTYNIACKNVADVNVSRCQQFDPAGSGEKLWNDLKENGKLTEKSTDENLKSM